MVTATQESLPALAGTEIGVSDWITIDQDRINKFAEATGDYQWIHVDVARAAKALLQSTHELLTSFAACWPDRMQSGTPMPR